MIIEQLTLQNFRNFEKISFSFAPGLNLIWGENGVGKSNVLEAVYFAATGRPHKATREGELIRFGQGIGRVEVRLQKHSSQVILEASLESLENFSARKILKMNHQPIRKLSELLGQVKVVLFTPHDQSIVYGEPSFRRRFLDFMQSQLSHSYLHALQEYQEVRAQRNSLLKQRSSSPSHLAPWNTQLIEFGSQVLLKRLELLPELEQATASIHKELSGGKNLSLSYQSSITLETKISLDEIKNRFDRALQKVAFEESVRGMTLIGPHRDDFRIFIEGIDARLFGSEGEQKTVAISLKLAEGKLFAELDREPPLYLLDDCFSELDSSRQKMVIQRIEPEAQSILTFTTPPPLLLEKAKNFELTAMESREAVSTP